MSPSRPTRSRHSARPAAAAALLVAVITACALLGPPSSGIAAPLRRPHPPVLGPRAALSDEASSDCHAVHGAADKCAFVLANCADDEPGLIRYLTFYYCSLGAARPVAFAVLAVWLGLLFTTIGIAASDFFSVNLSTIASVLGLSESLAGVTFLAFGNGSPDVFSTFAAMGSNSGSMAVGELIGAAGFITAVVAGSMALVREFKVNKRTFVRDIVFFIAAISFTMAFLADGELHLWECFVMIGFYVFYVVVVVGWHWLTARRQRQRMRDVASRTHFYNASAHGPDELEPYRDYPDEDETAPVGGRSRGGSHAAADDISILERGPRIEIGRVGAPSAAHGGAEDDDDDDDDDEEEEEERGKLVAAEMASSMRVNRPRWARSGTTTITPIRPSLVGALEFRSVLASLQKERNMHLAPLHGRSHSIHQGASSSVDDSRGRPRNKTLPAHVPAGTRERALSSGNPPLNLEAAGLSQPGMASRPDTRTSSTARTVDGRLAPPVGSVTPAELAAHGSGSVSPARPAYHQLLQIQIPPSIGPPTTQTSPSLSPFPILSDSPAALTPYQEPAAYPFSAPPLDARRHSLPGLDDQAEHPRPVKWWPYRLLPAPHVLFATLFPTLQGWKEKTLWDKLVSLISVPSIFLLVTTLPVVETERADDASEADAAAADPPDPCPPGNMAQPAAAGDGAAIEPETEWQAYRRRAHSSASRSSRNRSPSVLSLNAPHRPDEPLITLADDDEQPSPAAPVVAKPAGAAVADSDRATSSSSGAPSASAGWNRWLVAVQLFTGPLFVVFIVWANTAEDMEHPRKTLLRMVLYSLLVSLCLLAGLLATTTAERKPRYHFLLCFLGFVISVAWISTIAGEVVGVLKAFGVILDISEAILGLTVFAVGNSLGDLVADVTVARLGYPVMAL